jgi:Domain of unknown function (DUF4375)
MSDQPGLSYWSLIEPVWLPLNRSWDHGAEQFIKQFHAAPAKTGNLYAAHWCQSEVFNGGLFQFFYNTTGLLAPEASRGFQAIGLQEWSAVLTEAMSFFGASYPRERMVRLDPLLEGKHRNGEEWNPFRELDGRFNDWLGDDFERWEREANRYAENA